MALYPIKDVTGRILVTGANGFIGARLCCTLKTRGHTVVGGVRQGADLTNLAGLGIPLQYGDVTQPDSLPELLKEIDIVIHNAGLVKARSEERLFAVNTHGTDALAAEAIRNTRIKRLLFISSQAAAGPSRGGAKVELDPPNPITAYGRSKLQAERLLVQYTDKLNLQMIRPSGVYGPGDREVLTFFRAVARGVRPHIGRVKRIINMIYVDDLAAGIADVLEHDLPSGEIYALAHPEPQSFSELVGGIASALGKTGVSIPLPSALFRAAGSVSQMVRLFGGAPMLTREKAEEILAEWHINVTKAIEHFDFQPQIAFPEGARRTAQWYRERGWL